MERLCDLSGRQFVLECRPCERHGVYDLGRLRRHYGEHASVLDVYLRLTQSCRWQREIGSREPNQYAQRCRAKIVDNRARMPGNPRSRA